MADRVAKNTLFDGFAEVAKALGNGRRAELIDVLAQGERHVEELASEIEQSLANTSFHLQSLAAAGLVSTRREQTRIYYRLSSDRVLDLWSALREVTAAHLTAIDDLAAAYLGDRSELDEISREELSRRLELGEAIVVDVRPAPEFEAGHIAGARSIPIEQFAEQIHDLPDDAEVVAYCRGTYCVFADEAVSLLREQGLKARRLEGGYPEWRKANLN